MQTVVSLQHGTHFNLLPFILTALICFAGLYFLFAGRSKAARTNKPVTRKDTYDFIYGQLLEEKSA
jgi:hypothetical protein